MHMARYKNRSTESYYQDAQKFLAGSDRKMEDFMVKSAKRSQVLDREHRSYTDYCLAQGSLIHGHANRNVILGIKKIAEHGVQFDSITSEEINFARHIVKQVPGMDKVYFFESYAQTLKAAIDVARRKTQKQAVLTFDLCRCAEVESGAIVLPFNDTAFLEKQIEASNADIACIVIEFISAQYGIIPAQKLFLQSLERLSRRYQIPLILDERLTGFRNAPAEAQKEFFPHPDIICFSGIIGGGFPLGGLGLSASYGDRDFVRDLSFYPAMPYLSPVMLRAGLATLKQLSLEYYQRLNAKAFAFSEDLNAFFRDHGMKVRVSSYKSMMSLFFTDQDVVTRAHAEKAISPEKYAQLRDALFAEQILFPSAQTDPFFISLIHSRKELHKLLTSIKNFFRVSQ